MDVIVGLIILFVFVSAFLILLSKGARNDAINDKEQERWIKEYKEKKDNENN